MTVQRDLLQDIDLFLPRPEYLSIIGPRQCGKTTLLGIIGEHLATIRQVPRPLVQTVTFEDRERLRQFTSDPVAFVRSFRPTGATGTLFLMIDEFQYAPDGGQGLKLVYDTVTDLKVILTGSSSLDIRARVGKHMVGRVLTFELMPFSFREHLRGHDERLERLYDERHAIVEQVLEGGAPEVETGIEPFAEEMRPRYEDHAVWGGYPAVALETDERVRRKLLGDALNNYLLKDIKTLLELATDDNLHRLAQHLATQTGNVVVYGNLGQAAGLDHRQLRAHLNVLRQTFVSSELRPFFANRQKELVKNPKVYFFDGGFRNHLLDSFAPLGQRTDGGATVENVVFGRLRQLVGEQGQLNYWRTKSKAEVDFVVRQSGQLIPVEVKYAGFTQPRPGKSFLSFVDTYHPEVGLILTRDFRASIKRNGTTIVFYPACYL